MSKRSTARTRARNGTRAGITNPMRTKRSRFADRYQYEVRFFWWANIDEFRSRLNNVKFKNPEKSASGRHPNGRATVAYMDAGEFFILRMLDVDHAIWRAYQLVPQSPV